MMNWTDAPLVLYLPRKRDERSQPWLYVIAALIVAALTIGVALSPTPPGLTTERAAAVDYGD